MTVVLFLCQCAKGLFTLVELCNLIGLPLHNAVEQTLLLLTEPRGQVAIRHKDPLLWGVPTVPSTFVGHVWVFQRKGGISTI